MYDFMVMMAELLTATVCGCVGMLFIFMTIGAAIEIFYEIAPKTKNNRASEEKPTQTMTITEKQALLPMLNKKEIGYE